MSFDPLFADDLEKKAKDHGPFLTPEESRWRFGLRHVMLLVFIVALMCWIAVIGGVVLLIGSLILMVAAVVGVSVIAGRRRSTQQDALLWVLAIATERAMPLDPALEAFAEQCRGRYRQKVRAVAQALKHGRSLPDAFAHAPGTVSRDAETLLRVGYETGNLAGALREAAANRAGLRPVWAVVVGRVAYLTTVLFVMQWLFAFVMYFILPKFEAIFYDFGVPLPPITTSVVAFSHFLVKYFYITLLPLFVVEAVFLLLMPAVAFGGLRFDYGLDEIIGRKWSRLKVLVLILLALVVPFLGAFLVLWLISSLFDRMLFARRHAAVILRGLAWVVEGDRPMPWGIDLLSRCYPTRWVRRRLERVGEDLGHGEDWVESLAHRGLIRPADAAVLDAARRAGNLPWALRETADSGERRLGYRLQMVVNTVSPLLVIALGALVAAYAVAFFTPLVTLIERLAG